MRENLATFPDKASSLKLERGINTHQTKRRGGTRMRCNGHPRHCNQVQELQQPLPSRFGDVHVSFFFFLHLKELLNHGVSRTDNHM